MSTWEEGERGTKENRVAADEVEGASCSARDGVPKKYVTDRETKESEIETTVAANPQAQKSTETEEASSRIT